MIQSLASTPAPSPLHRWRASQRPDAVVDLRGPSYANKWWSTLRLVHKYKTARPSQAQRWRARFGAFGSIRRPVFILGCPRSGTTFLGELLEALPTATYFFEPPVLKYHTRHLYEGRMSLGRAKLLYQACFRLLLLGAPGHGRRIIEKNPNHLWVAATLHRIFPDAQFIFIWRDGRDTALSLLNKPWHLQESLGCGKREPGGYLFGPHPHYYIEPERAEEFATTNNLHRCIWIWRRHTEQLEKLRTMLPVSSQFHLRYETLIRQPTETLDQLLRFIGEEDAPSRRAVHAAAQLARDSSIGRWRSRLSPTDLDLIDREAGSLMRSLGYT